MIKIRVDVFNFKTIVIVCALLPCQQGYANDLTQTFQLALDNDPQYKSAYFNQYATAEIKSQSIAQMLPNISLTGSSARQRLNNKKVTFQGSGTQNFWNHSFTINFTQPVFHWEHWVQLSQSDNKIAQAEALFQAEYQELIVRITESYFNILAAQDNLKFTVAEKLAIGKQLEQASQRFEVGMIAITDVYEAQAAFDQARADEIEAENLLDDSKESLVELIGVNETELNLLQADIPFNLPEPEEIASWSDAAEKNNFNIVAQLNQTEVARKEINLNRSRHLPTIDIVASYFVSDNTGTSGLRGETQSVGLQLNLPIFEGGGTYSRTQQAQYEYQREKENLIKTKRTVTREVRNAYRDVVSNLSRVKALKAAVKSSESSLEATEAGFQVGTRTMVDILVEQRNLYRSKRDYSQSRYDYLVNGIKLKKAAGSLSEADLQNINQYLAH
jgi:outer membrane protein